MTRLLEIIFSLNLIHFDCLFLIPNHSGGINQIYQVLITTIPAATHTIKLSHIYGKNYYQEPNIRNRKI